MPESVLEVLSRSNVRHVSIIARRGPLEAAFTVKELRELMNLPEASMIPIEPSMLTPSPDLKLTRQQTRTLQLLRKGSVNAPGTTPKTWSLDFFRSPTGLVPPTSSTSAQLSLAHTTVDPKTQRAMATGETSTIPTSLVVTSLGFRSDPITPFYDPILGHLRALSGRIVTPSGTALRNVYTSGWAATGAKGVLASTMIDAYGVADVIMSDLQAEPNKPEIPPPTLSSLDALSQSSDEFATNPNPHPESLPSEIEAALKNGSVIEYKDWKAVDAEEVRRGELNGKERERMDWDGAHDYLERMKIA